MHTCWELSLGAQNALNAYMLYNNNYVTLEDICSRDQVYAPQLQRACWALFDMIVEQGNAGERSGFETQLSAVIWSMGLYNTLCLQGLESYTFLYKQPSLKLKI